MIGIVKNKEYLIVYFINLRDWFFLPPTDNSDNIGNIDKDKILGMTATTEEISMPTPKTPVILTVFIIDKITY